MKITKDFDMEEFQCKCGCVPHPAIVANITDLAFNLQILRDKIDKPIHITSGYRCKEYNTKIKGAPKSQHMEGKAADIQVAGLLPARVAMYIEECIADKQMREGGVGLYRNFTHYDGRGTKARWSM